MSSSPTAAERSGRRAAAGSEPRAVRTRERVLASIRDAWADGDAAALTVAEICRRAGIHRVTFYGHWSDLDDALADAVSAAIDTIAAVDPDDGGDTSPTALARRYETALRPQLERLAEARRVTPGLIGTAALERRLHDVLEARAALAIAALTAAGVDVPGAASGIAAAQLAGGVVAASLEWLRRPELPVEVAVADMRAQLPRWWPREV